ncbi:MAG: class I SAM-dependent methyltransferase [Nitrosopumilus sp.]|uniref:class I SAM-dependent methyltransferase n=1 Tax=Nitrosopumilus sp. TaxID=2024843 RepID=UPI00247D6D3A|nr:class I SAM-dependent methyltransferase [Nitrosopumilus sp.]MCV0393725.1 class I SAM-dependent methyltransferase [Nitrosopumilus sp.]
MIRISPNGKKITDKEMQEIFDRYDATRESIFRRHEMNLVIKYTKGVGIEVGCGLNKIHTSAIGINKVLTENDYGYPFGTQIQSEGDNLPWFRDNSLDYVFSSHCLEHIVDSKKALREWTRVLKKEGYLVLILPHKNYFPNIGQPNANPDHKHDFLPEDVKKMIDEIGKYEIISIDTLHDNLKKDEVAMSEAPKYGHSSLNFSFEIIAKKIKD